MKNNNLVLPDIEKVCSKVHAAWMESKKAEGINSRTKDGEELMVPYEELSDTAKNFDRVIVNAVYKAIEELSDIPEEEVKEEAKAEAQTSL